MTSCLTQSKSKCLYPDPGGCSWPDLCYFLISFLLLSANSTCPPLAWGRPAQSQKINCWQCFHIWCGGRIQGQLDSSQGRHLTRLQCGEATGSQVTWMPDIVHCWKLHCWKPTLLGTVTGSQEDLRGYEWAFAPFVQMERIFSGI